MTLEIRVLGDEHAADVFALRMQAFRVPPASLDAWRAQVDLSNFLGAFDGSRLVGVTAALPLGQHFGGRAVPMGGVATVAVAAEDRGRGVAGRLLGAAIGMMHDRGDALSALHPATTRLYRAHGWELAGERPVWRVPTAALRDLPGPGPGSGSEPEPVVLRAGSAADRDRIRACYERVAPDHDGWLARPAGWWDALASTDGHRYLSLARAEGGYGGEVMGYVRYRQVGKRPDWGYRLRVDELVAATPGAERALWRLIGSYASQAERVTVAGCRPDWLLLALPEQVVRAGRSSHWMARPIDAAAAVAARGYRPVVNARVELHVHDPHAPWNDGDWILEVAGGEGRLRRGGYGSVRLGAGALACLYTGWTSAANLVAAGLVHAPVDAVAGLDAVFAGSRPAMLDHF